ncbi:hypothetical protein M378DRAFT_22060 [Amanita muscaria Koide BX008]|uniref:Uncharacterized protein n=1 Tax=Amanita muscaria (strain Koide BX008) TaxID=946122 RepID=A0A0C2X362_AMAMK|nr:hypothetical protein M378DRAFT_22060 [Amanita muscaria Koide BX008]
MSEPPTKKQRLDTAMDTTPSSQPLPPDDGSEFDRKVLALCEEGRLAVDSSEALIGSQMVTLLIAILKNDKDLVQISPNLDTFDFDNVAQVIAIIRQHPTLRADLQEAWKLKKFEMIRRLSFLQVPGQDQGGNDQGRVPETVSTSIRKAWDLRYESNAHEVLYHSICDMWKPGVTPYQNILAILQSSGYGKTRMLDEQAKLVFTFPFVVRDPSETRLGSAFPHPDKSVHDFVTTFGSTEEEAMTGYYRFFSHLFVHALTIIKESDRQSKSLPEWWRDYLAKQNNRETLYSEAVKFAKSSITHLSSSQSDVQEGDNQLGVDVAAAVEELLKVLKKEANGTIKVVIYFDEAHELSNYQVKPNNRNRLEVLYTCLDVFSDSPLMFIFTSTTSNLHRLPSPRSKARSARREMGNSVGQAPITELPFDCHHSFPLKPDLHSFQAICELRFLANFGRPLFWSLLESGGNEEDVLRFAKDKLAPLNSELVFSSRGQRDKLPTYSETAIIDLLLMLDYNPDHKNVQDLQKELVASHMRTCISIPADREYMHSCYPSEPFLAEAAMAKLTQMLHPKTGVSSLVIDTVNAHFSQGLLHSGDLGELAARMLLMDAYMSACNNGGSGEQVIYSKGCKLTDFWQSLFREFNIVLEAKPDNVFDGPTLQDAFKDAVVRFTHFGKFVDDTATSRDAAHAAFFRSMAIVCHDTQESVDIIVPVLSTTDGMVCPHVITAILIQIKRRLRPSNAGLLAIDQSKLEFFSEDTLCKCGRQPRNTKLNLPYISLVLDLGVRERRTYAMPTHSYLTSPATLAPRIMPAVQPLVQAGAPPQRSSSRKQQEQKKHNRYAIYARGLSPYCSVNEQNLPKYERLLHLSNLLGDHPRQSLSNLTMVQRLKPFWARGEAFDWIENEALTFPPMLTEDDGLEVGKYEGEEDDT